MTEPASGYTLSELVEFFGGEVVGDDSVRVTQVATLESAGPTDIAFFSNPRYGAQLAQTRAGAVILSESAALRASGNCIVTQAPYTYYARVAQLFNPLPVFEPGVAPSAIVKSPIPASVTVCAQACVGRNVSLGEGVVIGEGCVIGDDVSIGAGSRLMPRVCVYAGCIIGEAAIIHSGAVIGSDGFGFARETDGSWLKIPQIGRVVIGDNVEIGANTTIDRGALDDTVIGSGVILDNQIQIGHNVHIGENSAIAGCVGIAGSTRIGRRVMIGGAAMIIGHLEIADDVTISSCTMITKSVAQAGTITGTVPQQSHQEWLKNFSQLRHLAQLSDKVRALEQRLAELDSST